SHPRPAASREIPLACGRGWPQSPLARPAGPSGNLHEDVVGSLQWLAQLHEQREDFKAARAALQEVVAIKEKVYGVRHWQATDARLARARSARLALLDEAQRLLLTQAGQASARAAALSDQGKVAEAIALADRALQLYQQVLGDKHPDYAQGAI